MSTGSLSVAIDSDLDGEAVQYSYTTAFGATVNCVVKDVSFASGASTITIPSSTTAVCITPDTDETAVLRLIGQDGVELHSTRPTFLATDSISTSLACWASATHTRRVVFYSEP